MTKEEPKYIKTQIRIPKYIKERLNKLAEENNRSFNNLAATILINYVNDLGRQ